MVSVIDTATGRLRLLAERCSTCILRPGDLMHLGPKRLREFIGDARRRESYVVCHQTLPEVAPDGVSPAICRGFSDAYSTNALRMGERLLGFDEVPPPSPEGSR